jgi:hypothetical protein
MSSSCAHDGFHSGQGRDCHRTGRLRYLIFCDTCQAEVRSVAETAYRPRFEPFDPSVHLPRKTP